MVWMTLHVKFRYHLGNSLPPNTQFYVYVPGVRNVGFVYAMNGLSPKVMVMKLQSSINTLFLQAAELQIF